MYRERRYCTYCLTTIYREERRRPKLPEIDVFKWVEEVETIPVPLEIEYLYRYFDEQGEEVVRCPGCSRFIRSSRR